MIKNKLINQMTKKDAIHIMNSILKIEFKSFPQAKKIIRNIAKETTKTWIEDYLNSIYDKKKNIKYLEKN